MKDWVISIDPLSVNSLKFFFLDPVRKIVQMEGDSKTIELSDICTLTITKSDCKFDVTGTSCSTEEVLKALFSEQDLIYSSGGFIPEQ